MLRDISKTNRGDKLDDLSIAKICSIGRCAISNSSRLRPAARTKETDITPLILGRHSPADVLLLGYGTARAAGVDIHPARTAAGTRRCDARHARSRSSETATALACRRFCTRTATTKSCIYSTRRLGLADPRSWAAKASPRWPKPSTIRRCSASLDLDDSHHYAVKSAEAKQAIALVEASPGYLAADEDFGDAANGIGSAGAEQFAGGNRGAAEKSSHLKSEPRLWTWPYEVLCASDRSAAQAPQGVQDVFVAEEAPFLLPAHHGELRDPRAEHQEESVSTT